MIARPLLLAAGALVAGAVSLVAGVARPGVETATALDGAALFDPMGTGRVMHHTVLLPESVIDEPDELRGWLRKALDHVATLPPKTKRPTPKPARPATRGSRRTSTGPAT